MSPGLIQEVRRRSSQTNLRAQRIAEELNKRSVKPPEPSPKDNKTPESDE